jgi:hypothetical protein
MREIYFGEFRLILIQHIREVDAKNPVSATGGKGYRTTRFQQPCGKQYPRIGPVLCGYD